MPTTVAVFMHPPSYLTNCRLRQIGTVEQWYCLMHCPMQTHAEAAAIAVF
jgi:hypothetical protein